MIYALLSDAYLTTAPTFQKLVRFGNLSVKFVKLGNPNQK